MSQASFAFHKALVGPLNVSRCVTLRGEPYGNTKVDQKQATRASSDVSRSTQVSSSDWIGSISSQLLT